MSTQQSEFEDKVSFSNDNENENSYSVLYSNNNEEELSDSESDSGDSSTTVSSGFSDAFTGNGMRRLDEASEEYERVKKRFIMGMGLAAGRETKIVAINKKMLYDFTSKARFASFKIFLQAVGQRCSGNPNVKYGWYGGSKEEILEILGYGFSERSPNEQSHGGIGIHLFHDELSGFGVASSPPDENGLKHILLCCVIVGKTETVAEGSNQSHPSSGAVDTGVDNAMCPTRYIVWNAFMNSHIFPVYAISFKAPSFNLHSGLRFIPLANAAATSNPSVTTLMSPPAIVSMLSKFLPPPKVVLLANCLRDFTENKMTKAQMGCRMRQIAGDRLTLAAMRYVKRKWSGFIVKSNNE